MKTSYTDRIDLPGLAPILRVLLPALLLFVTHSSTLAASTPSSTWLPAIEPPPRSPARVALDPQGNLYVVDSHQNTLTVRDPAGRLLTTRSGLQRPLGLAIDNKGVVYLGETGPRRVSVFDSQWNRLGVLGQGDGEFLLPSHLAVGTNGGTTTVYVSDTLAHQVKAYRNGAKWLTLGDRGSNPGQFNLPAGLFVNASGELFVVDQNNDRIQVFGADGTYLRAFSLRRPSEKSRSSRAQGLAADPEGRLYVADLFQGFIRVFDAQGQFLSSLGNFGTGPGQFRSPADLALDTHGRLFVADLNNSRVAVVGLDCPLSLTATPSQQPLATGGNLTLAVTAGCAETLTCNWRRGTNDLIDGPNLSGANTPTLTLANLIPGDAGDYSAVVQRSNRPVEVLTLAVDVVTAPVLVRGLNSISVLQGRDVVLEVEANGSGLTYEWFFNGSLIADAAEPRLTLPSVQPTAKGTYSVRISNPAGSLTSTATLAIYEAPSFVVEPVGQTVPEGGSVSLMTLCTTNLPTSFQWYFNESVLIGQNRTTLSLSNLTPALSGDYFIVAMNSAGRSTSQVATVTVTPDTVPPQLLTAYGGRATNRSITLTFSKPLKTATAQALPNYVLTGPGGLRILSAVSSQGSNVILNLSGPRVPNQNYTVRVSSILDNSYSGNALDPNPTLIAVSSQFELVSINTTRWKYLQPVNNAMDSQPWKLPTYSDNAWLTGLGIFYGNRTNSIYQPNPNPNVTLPLVLNSSDPLHTRVYTILNVFTNAGNAIQTPTYYFRTAFDFPAQTRGASLLLHAIIDDGAVFWLNGQELRRDRMSSGTPGFSTLASSSGSQNWSPSITADATVLPLTNLKSGTNVLAIEVHQRTSTDSDVTLGVWLEATATDFRGSSFAPPELAVRVIGPGTPEALLEISWVSLPGYSLETASGLVGPWVIVASSSPYLVPITGQPGPSRFYRLRQTN